MTHRAAPARVAHLVSHPIPYFAALYRELARRPEIDLTVYFYSDASAQAHYDKEFSRTVEWEPDLLEGYRWHICRSAHGSPLERPLRPHLDVVWSIARARYDVVWAHGYSQLATWLAALTGRLGGARLLIREEATLLRRRPLPVRLVKGAVLKALFRQASGLYIGQHNRRFFEHYGMPADRLFPAPYCVDNRFFAGEAARLAPRKTEIRAACGVPGEAPVILFCGKLVDRKRPLVLLEAFSQVRRNHECRLLLVGDGPARGAIQDDIARRRIPDVMFAGFAPQSQLTAFYGAADVFALLSSFEPWGLVVNEAMNFGLPLVVTATVGSSGDLVRHGWNGFVVPTDDATAAAHALEQLVCDPVLRRRFGSRSNDLVSEYSIEACADGIVRACVDESVSMLNKRAA